MLSSALPWRCDSGGIGSQPSSEPAPPPTVIDFARATHASPGAFAGTDDGAPSGMESGVRPDEARRIVVPDTRGGAYPLLVAPTAKGGFCLSWPMGGGCQANRAQYLRKGLLIGGTYEGSPASTSRLWGSVIAPGTRSVDVIYEDAARDIVRLVWVSTPINAGFFVHTVPPDNRRQGHHVIALVARDADGNEIAREQLGAYES